MIDEYGKKLEHDPGNIQFVNSIIYDQYEKVMSCNKIDNNIVKRGDKEFVCELKYITTHDNHLLYLTLITKDIGSGLNGRLGIISHTVYPLLQYMTPSYAIFMKRVKICCR